MNQLRPMLAGLAALALVTACDTAADPTPTPTPDADTQVLTDTGGAAQDSASADAAPDSSAAGDTAEAADDTAAPTDADTVGPEDTDDDTSGPVDVDDDTSGPVDVDDDTSGPADVEDDTSGPVDADDDTAPMDAVEGDTATPPDGLSITPPEGFYEIDAGRGITIYQKDYEDGLPDWVTVVDLRVAELRVVIGDFVGAPDGSVKQRSFMEHWDDAVSREAAYGRRAKVMVNGGFFSPSPDPAPIAFGLHVDGVVISYGYGLDEFPGYIKTLAWTPADANATISDYDVLTFEAFDNVAGGLAHDAPHPAAATKTGRTFMGTADLDGDGSAEALFIFSSDFSNQADAGDILLSFGATELIMLDGGSSSAMLVDGVELVHPGRRHPISLAVYEGPEPSGCAEACGPFGTCDPATGACVCADGFSGPTCATCSVCQPEEVVVDDGDPGFTTYGQIYWYIGTDGDGFESGAVGGGFHYTYGDPNGQRVWAARWVSPHPLDGTYDVQVHVAPIGEFNPGHGVSTWTQCDQAPYLVVHDDAPQGGEAVTIDHHATGWVTLRADAHFSLARGDVRVHDRAQPSLCGVQADAVRWVRKP